LQLVEIFVNNEDMKIELTKEEKLKLEQDHRSTRDMNIGDRIKAVLLKSEGWQDDAIAQALRIHVSTVRRYLDDYVSKQKLAPESGGSSGYLNAVQTEELIAHLMNQTYVTVQEICVYVDQQYGVKYSISGMTDWLHANRFSYKYPKQTPAKADPAKQEEFVQYYEELVASSPAQEPIFFGDSVHPTQATKVSCGWIRTGEEKLIGSTGSRTRMNICGALNLEDMSLISASYDTINTASIIEFLTKLRSNYAPEIKIHYIVDQAGYHTSAETRDFAEKNNIKLHYLPPYSPNLNPIERVWKVMNEKVRNNKYFATSLEFKRSIGDFLDVTWDKIANNLIDRINDNFTITKQAF